MTDMRRTMLWVVFTMSLVLLWDAWNKHTGQPSIFGGSSKPAISAGASPGSLPSSAPGGVPAATPAVPVAGAALAALPPAPAVAAASEQITLSTDVAKATFDTLGGSLVRLELLGHRDMVDPARNLVLFEQSAKRLYVAQSGLITGTAGVVLPNHLTPMVVSKSERTLAPNANEINISFESAAIDGHKLVKTYTLKRGAYTVDVKHEFSNQSTASVPAQVYLQLARDGNPPEGESSFYFTFTGPAVYTEAKKFQKVEFKDIAKSRDFSQIATHPKFAALMKDPELSSLLMKINPAQFKT